VLDALDVVRAFYRAVNRADVEAVAALYHPDCILEHVFADDAVIAGREEARARWTDEVTRHAGALPGGDRVDVRQIGGMEAGWGWVRSEWVNAVRPALGGDARQTRGHSHFWVENGLIRRHRSVSRAGDKGQRTESQSDRQFPTRPIVGVGAVVLTDDRQVVLVKRRHEPLAGQWSLPGGTLELGETLEAGTAREIREETGLIVEVGPVVEVFDRILLDEHERVQYHFVLVDYLCRVRGGRLEAGTDVDDAALVRPDALDPYRITDKARGVIDAALRLKGDR
jgi:ADP-ribose pyrophosphatase YjhB (NUDIX family)